MWLESFDLVDTSDGYGADGHNERLVGRALREREASTRFDPAGEGALLGERVCELVSPR